ncbi:hypothetical protein P7K49_031318 [Saguinus oedipus]|uniref:HAP1 N-terminal domain-containing protein n=1 Tax=Saguinus oedipus TaxID=9490 RepID=A0ABQ9TZ25_SAGOE|nr:hypothetical protein P7K49_031318 [Saguinus oedipus]
MPLFSSLDAEHRWLLQEMQKERDLELAARIGQSLLKKNKTLTERNELLEEQVEHVREERQKEMAERGPSWKIPEPRTVCSETGSWGLKAAPLQLQLLPVPPFCLRQ